MAYRQKTDEVHQGGTGFSQQRISLLDENRETVSLILQTQSNERVQYRDNTINVDINYPTIHFDDGKEVANTQHILS